METVHRMRIIFLIWKTERQNIPLSETVPGKNFLLDILPTDDGMRIKLIEKNQETQYSWPDGEATDAIIDEVYHKATS